MKTSKCILSLLACVSFLSLQATAAPVVITGDKADRETYTGPGWAATDTATTLRVGAGGSAPHLERAAVYVFQLPAGLAAADITDVSFSTTIITLAGTPTFNFDLYALNARSAKDVLTTDHYAGANDTRSGVTLIQKDFATKDVAAGLISISDAGKINLTSFVQSQLNAGKAGQYIFLRINANVSATSGGLNLASADNTSVMVPPTLTISTTNNIPEPGALVMVIGAGALFFAIRFRARRR